jgi:hypothetical protein
VFDGLREHLLRLPQIIAGVEQLIYLSPVRGLLFDLVEIALVREKWILGLLLRRIVIHGRPSPLSAAGNALKLQRYLERNRNVVRR